LEKDEEGEKAPIRPSKEAYLSTTKEDNGASYSASSGKTSRFLLIKPRDTRARGTTVYRRFSFFVSSGKKQEEMRGNPGCRPTEGSRKKGTGDGGK